jgi:hypothetical protein
MVDTQTTTASANINDECEVAPDSGELDKQIEQEKFASAANQVKNLFVEIPGGNNSSSFHQRKIIDHQR